MMRPLFARAVAEHEALRGGSRRRALSAPHRLAEALPQRPSVRGGRRASAKLRRSSASPMCRSIAKRRARWSRRSRRCSVTPCIGRRRERQQSAGADAGLCRALCGARRRCVHGDARSAAPRRCADWRVDTAAGPIDAGDVVVALGPWAPDLLDPLGIKLPLAVKRGYHAISARAAMPRLSRPILDAENGYCLAPMEQGIRLTTGAEFAARDAPPTPVQFDRLLPAARELFPLGEPVEPKPWLGARPCFADSRPVIARAPGPARPVARLRPRPLGLDARPGDRPAHRRDDDGRDAVLRSDAVRAERFA